MSEHGHHIGHGSAEGFFDMLGDIVVDLAKFRQGNRILALKPASYAIVADAAREVADRARALGFQRLAEHAETMAALMTSAIHGISGAQQRFLTVQSYQNFLDEARMTIRKGVAPARRRSADGRFTVLVVDDEEIELELVARTLGADVEVLKAVGPDDAMSFVDDRHPDLIILDVNLGTTSGTTLLTRLKAAFETRHIPVVMRSNNYDDATVVSGLLGGALDFVPKTDTLDVLRRKTMDVLQNGRARLHATGQMTAA